MGTVERQDIHSAVGGLRSSLDMEPWLDFGRKKNHLLSKTDNYVARIPCWPLVPKFAGSNPAEAVGFFRAKKSSAPPPSEGK